MAYGSLCVSDRHIMGGTGLANRSHLGQRTIKSLAWTSTFFRFATHLGKKVVLGKLVQNGEWSGFLLLLVRQTNICLLFSSGQGLRVGKRYEISRSSALRMAQESHLPDWKSGKDQSL